MINVLMIEDDLELAEILIEFLNKCEISVKNYADPFIALSELSINKYDLVILDLTLDGIDGLEVCKQIRKNHKIPIIISSARSKVSDKVEALKIGADDYIPKPYDPMELEARIISQTRRYKEFNTTTKKNEVFKLDRVSKTLYKNGEMIKLTLAEYEIIEYLVSSKGAIISREILLDNIQSLSNDENNNSLAVIIGRIRNKIEDEPKNPKHLITVRGIGYKFV